jgi:hypothetical protein
MAARGSDDSLLPADDLAGQNAGKQYPATKNKLKLLSSSTWGKHLSGGQKFTSRSNSNFRSVEILGADRETWGPTRLFGCVSSCVNRQTNAA